MNRKTNRSYRLALAIPALVLALVAQPANATTNSRVTFHRLNPDQSNPAPEHERINCLAGEVWLCLHDKKPEPSLGFSWNRIRGIFVGKDSTETWACPDWFPGDVCSEVVTVAAGTMTFFRPGFPPASVSQELITTSGDDLAPFYVYWTGAFVCPWYGTFDEAIEANPLPLPFNGNWPAADCTFAP